MKRLTDEQVAQYERHTILAAARRKDGPFTHVPAYCDSGHPCHKCK